MNIYVGNLSPETTEEDLRQAFEAFGQVISVKVLRDRVTGESNGFGFVGMQVSDEGQTAISELNGKDLKGHTIKVEEGRMKTSDRSDRDRQDSLGGGRGDRDRQDGFDRGGRGDRDRRGGFDRGGRGGRRY
jgi:RNA recognition motif-containing protein